MRDTRQALQRPLARRLVTAFFLLWAFDRLIYFATETQWHNASGFGDAWRIRVQAQVVLFGGAFGLTALPALFLWPLATLPASPPRLPPQYVWLERRLRLLSRFNGRAVLLFILLGALWNGWAAAKQWPQWLLFWHGDNWGVQTPLWAADVSWWVFRLPFWNLLLNVLRRALLLSLFCGFLLALGRGTARFFSRHPALPQRALRGLILLGTAFFLLRALRCALMPFSEMASLEADALWNARLPAWWLSAFFNMGAAFVLAFYFWRTSLPRFAFMWSLGLALFAPPLLLFLSTQNEKLFGLDKTFVVAGRTATEQAWALNTIEITDWHPLNAPRTAPPSVEWLKHLTVSAEKPPAKENKDQSATVLPFNSSLWHVLWVWRLRHFTLTSGQKDFSYRRTLEEQRAALTPFLWPGDKPRFVKEDDKIFQLQELLAVTPHFPGAAAETIDVEGQIKTINSARAAVLLTREVTSGLLKFYALQEEPDALTKAWQDALPGLILPLQELPVFLKKERRYPAELLKRQAHQLSRVAGTNWHMAPPTGTSGLTDTEEPFFTRLPSGETSLQITLCRDTNGANLAALLRASCDRERLGELSLLRFDAPESATRQNEIAPLDSGLLGPNALAERVADALPQPTILQDEKPVTQSRWRAGAVCPIAVEERVWLWQPLFREHAGQKRYAGMALTNAAWPDGPVGVGRDGIEAMGDWTQLAKLWNETELTPGEFSLASRLRALLEPATVQKEAQIATLVQRAASLHEAAAQADKTSQALAAQFRREELKTLQNLQKLVPVATSTSGPKSP